MKKGREKADELEAQLKWYGPGFRLEMYVGWLTTANSLQDVFLADRLRDLIEKEIDHVKDIEKVLQHG